MRLRFVVPADVERPTGGNAYDLALAGALRQAGVDVEVECRDPGELAAVLRRRWDGPTLVDGLLASTQPDAVAAATAAGAVVAVLVHMPLALDHGLSSERVHELDGLERRALQAATTVIATSRWSAEQLVARHGLPRVAVARPGAGRTALSRGSDPPLLVHLAALLPNKNQLGVVAALREVADLPWRARLVGPDDRDPGYAAAVREAVRAAGLQDRVDVPGALQREVAWAGADLALLPSYTETFGMVVTEALARGVPAVVSEGGATEALGLSRAGVRPGVVLPAGDTAALNRALRRWLTDPRHRGTLREAVLSRRSTLEGWDVTARRVRMALARA